MGENVRNIVVDDKDLVASRVYSVLGKVGESFTVRFGRPSKDPEGYYRCDIEFRGDCENESIFTSGVDGVDAIDSAFWMAGTILVRISEKYFGQKLVWSAYSEGRPIGLPSIPISHVADGNFRDYV